MTTRFSVFTRILGEDFASEAFRKVGNAARTAFGPVTAFNKAVSEPSSNALGRVGTAVDGVSAKFRGGLSSLTGWLPALGAIGSALSLAGLIEMTKRSSEAFEGLSLATEKLGVSRGWLSGIRFSAKQAGVDAEQLEKGMVKLKKAMFDAGTGKDKDAAALFAAMKIPLRDAHGNFRKLEEVSLDVAQAMHNTEDETVRNAMALKLFGKAGAELIPWLNKGRDAIKADQVLKAKYSSLTDRQSKDMEHLANSYKLLDAAGSGLATRISASFAPLFTKVVDLTSDWIAKNREFIGLAIERKIALWSGVFDAVATGIGKVLELPFVREIGAGVTKTDAFSTALGALQVTMAGPILAAIGTLTGALIRMNVAALTNPFILFPAIVAAGAYAIYANWGPITSWWDQKMDAIRSAADRGLGAGLLEVVKRFEPIGVMQDAINGLSKWLFGVDLAAAGKNLIKTLIDGIKSLLPDFDKVWSPIREAINFAMNPGRVIIAGGAAVHGQVASNIAAGDVPSPMFADGIPMIPSAPSPASAPGVAPTARAPEVKGTIELIIKAPPGAEVSSKTSGPVTVAPVGYSMVD